MLIFRTIKVSCSSSTTPAQVLTPDLYCKEECRVAYEWSTPHSCRLWKLFIAFLLQFRVDVVDWTGGADFCPAALVKVVYGMDATATRPLHDRVHFAGGDSLNPFNWLALQHLILPFHSTHYVCRGQLMMWHECKGRISGPPLLHTYICSPKTAVNRCTHTSSWLSPLRIPTLVFPRWNSRKLCTRCISAYSVLVDRVVSPRSIHYFVVGNNVIYIRKQLMTLWGLHHMNK
jgi:hypothetical protein